MTKGLPQAHPQFLTHPTPDSPRAGLFSPTPACAIGIAASKLSRMRERDHRSIGAAVPAGGVAVSRCRGACWRCHGATVPRCRGAAPVHSLPTPYRHLAADPATLNHYGLNVTWR